MINATKEPEFHYSQNPFDGGFQIYYSSNGGG